MSKDKIIETLEAYGRINNIGTDDRVKVLGSLESDARKLGLEYEYYRQAIIAAALRKDAETVSAGNRAIDEAIRIGNDHMVSEINLFLGIHFRMKYQYDIAFKHYFAALKVETSARAYNNLADIYLLIDATEEANRLLDKAIEIINSKSDKTKYHQKLVNTVFTNKCEVDVSRGKYEAAKENALKVIETSEQIDDFLGIGYGHTLLGSVYRLVGDIELAIVHLKKAEDVFSNCNKQYFSQVVGYLDEAYYQESLCLAELGNFKDAVYKLNLISYHRTRDYEVLLKCYQALNDNEMIFKIYKDFFNFIVNDEKEKKLRQKENFITTVAVHETEKKANEYELLYSSTKSISEIGRQIISAEKLDDVLLAIHNHVDKIMGFNSLALGMIGDGLIEYKWVLEDNKRLEPFFVKVKNMNSFSSWVVRNKSAIRLNDMLTPEELKKYKEVPDIKWYGNKMDSMLIVPIQYKDEVLGIINLQSKEQYNYTEYDLEVITMLASFIGVAMKNWQGTYELREANEKLEELSKTDALTGISNRHILSEIVEDLFRGDVHKEEYISVVMIDIDHFKEYNDTYGHIDGDRCIISIVDVLRDYLDTGINRMFRYGGDEFVAIIPYLTSDEIEIKLEKARKSIEDLKIPNRKSKVSDFVTCSFGYTIVQKGKKDYQRAFYLADEALYQAKANGKNTIAYVEDEVK